MALQDILAELAVNLRLNTVDYSAGVDKATQKTSQLERRLLSFQKSAGGVGKALLSLGGGLGAGFAAGLGIDALVRATQASLEYAGSLGETAQQLGVTARDLQIFRFAAGQVGVSQDQLEVGLKKLRITMGQLALGAEAPRKAFDALHKGLADQLVAAKDGGEQFRILADALEPVASSTKRATIETVAMGKAGSALDNLLTGGSRALNEFAQAADKLGLIISDDQIRRADDAADALTRLKTVMSAKIASALAGDADSVRDFANSLIYLVDKAASALDWLKRLREGFDEYAQLYSLPSQFIQAAGYKLDANQLNQFALNGGSVTLQLPPATPVKKGGGADIDKFLAPTPAKDHSADDALRKRLAALSRANEYDQRQLRAQEDVLRGQQDLSDDYSERASIGVQLLDLDKKGFAAQLAFEVEQNKLSKGEQGITQAQADALMAWYEQKDKLDRQNVLKDEELARQEEFNANQATFYALQQDRLQAESSFAETAAERRKIELEILDLAYKEKKERLERIVAESKNATERDQAERELRAMPGQYQIDRKNVEKSTRGPLDEYLATLPTTAAKMNEALQRVEVEGLQGLENGILDVIQGTKKLGQAFRDMTTQILADLIKIGIEKAVIAPLANALFGSATANAPIGARALGGPVMGGRAYLVGERGPEIFMPSGSGRVYSNSDSRAMRGGLGGGWSGDMIVYARDADSFGRSQGQIARRWRRQMAAA